MSRVVDPILADARWEDGRLTARAIFALMEALAQHAMTSLPGWFAAACSDDRYALIRAAAFMLVGATVASAAMTSYPINLEVRRLHVSLYPLGIRLVPQAVAICLPAMLVLTISTVFGEPAATKSIVGRTLLLTAACLALSAAFSVVVIPRAGLTHRVVLDGRPLPKGPNETGFAALRAVIQDLEHAHGGHSVAQRLEYEYQVRAAVMVSPVPFGIAGMAIVALAHRRRRAIPLAICVIAGYWALVASEGHVANALIIRGGFLPEYFCAWTPNLLLLIASGAVLAARSSGNDCSLVTVP
jgi:hypothetical protein